MNTKVARKVLLVFLLLALVPMITLATHAAVPVTPMGSEFRVNTQAAENQTQPGVAMDEAGNFVIIWLNRHGTNLNDIYG